MLEWPEGELGFRPLIDDFSYEEPDGRYRNPMDRGPSKSRGGTEGTANLITCSSEPFWNADQLARWRRWWKEDTGGGNLPFKIRDPQFDGLLWLTDSGGMLLTGEVVLDEEGLPVLVVDTDEAELLAPTFDDSSVPLICTYFWLVRFGEAKPIERQVGLSWRVSWMLERLDG